MVPAILLMNREPVMLNFFEEQHDEHFYEMFLPNCNCRGPVPYILSSRIFSNSVFPFDGTAMEKSGKKGSVEMQHVI